MSPGLAVILVTALYKLSCLTVGCLFCSLGYRLFRSGIWGNAGDMETKFKDVSIVLKSAAPGTFFAVLGAAIVVVTVWQGMSFNWRSTVGTGTDAAVTAPTLPDSDGGGK
jgi:hypothetical protein